MPVKSKDSVGPCELSLDIEVEATKVADAVDKAYREFSKYVSVPGFRKGKAPMSFIRQRVPQDQVRERTAELLVGPAYEAALKENEIKPYARPKVELIKLETTPPDYVFEFKALVPLPPTVELGKYKGLEVVREFEPITDEMVEARIKSFQDRSADFNDIEDRPSQVGDVITGDLSVTPVLEEGDEGYGEVGELNKVSVLIGDPNNIPGVDANLTGLTIGDTAEFRATYPLEHENPDIAGTTANFVFTVDNIRERILPPLDDEFAKKIGHVDTMDEFRTMVKLDMTTASDEKADREAETKLIDLIAVNSQINFPSVLLDIELEDDIKTFNEELERSKTSFEDYLQRTGLTEDLLMKIFRERAEQRLRRGLVLGEVSKVENLAITDEDVEKEIETRAAAQRTSVQAMKAFIDSKNTMDAIRNQAYTKKLIGFLLSNSTITSKPIAPVDVKVSEKALEQPEEEHLVETMPDIDSVKDTPDES